MTTTHEVIRAAIPGASAEVCDYILWGRTPHPMGNVTARDLYRAAAGAARAQKHGLALCECCERPAVPGAYLCPNCSDALKEA